MTMRGAVGKGKSLLRRLRSSGTPPAQVFEAADELRREGELEAAADLCREGLGQLPESASGHVVFGEVLRDQGRPELAEKEWLEAIRLQPAHPRAHLRLAQLYLGRGEMPRAMAELEQSLLYSPNFPEAEALLSMARRTGEEGHLDAGELTAGLRQHPAVTSAAVVDRSGEIAAGDARIGADAAGLAARLMLCAQPLVERLHAGPLLSVSITGTAGGVLCAAVGERALVATLQGGSDGQDLARLVTPGEGTTGGDIAGHPE